MTDFGMARDVLDDNIYQTRSKVLNYFEPKVGVEISQGECLSVVLDFQLITGSVCCSPTYHITARICQPR